MSAASLELEVFLLPAVRRGRHQQQVARARTQLFSAKFDQPEVKYRNKSVCVTGQIKTYQGVWEVVAFGPTQIKIQAGGEK